VSLLFRAVTLEPGLAPQLLPARDDLTADVLQWFGMD
jgi:hypothetical protein